MPNLAVKFLPNHRFRRLIKKRDFYCILNAIKVSQFNYAPDENHRVDDSVNTDVSATPFY